MIRKVILAEVCGILAISLALLLINLLSIEFFSQGIMSPGVTIRSQDDLNQFLFSPPYIYFRWFAYFLRLLVFILGGFIVGIILKQKGWFWGGLLGFIQILCVLLISVGLFLSLYHKNIDFLKVFEYITSNVLTIALTAIGGLIGEIFTKLRKRKKSLQSKK